LHAIGNFGKAEFGGREKTLCIAPSVYLKNIFNELSKNAQDSDYEASIEATHHGPYLEKPVLFVEIGSSEKEWIDENAGNIIAKSIINIIKKDNNIFNEKNLIINNESMKKINNDENNNYESVFVIGGSHYNHVANKVMLKTDLAVGHICAKYNLENLDESLIKEAMEKTIPKAKFVLLDWKGLGKEKQRVVGILEKNNIEYKRSDKIF
jgi:D-aminoacyl-tRNA deacylase